MKTTLLITTYNKPEFLCLVLQSLKRQTVMPDEVVILAEEFVSETKTLVDEFAKNYAAKVKCVRRDDINKAVTAAEGDYIIQIDDDIIMHDKFVADHISVARENYIAKGSCVRLSPGYTAQLRVNRMLPLYISIFSHGILKGRMKTIRLPWLGRIISRLCYCKSRENGSYKAYWRENFIGANDCKTFKPFRMCICYRLWHKEADKYNNQ